MNLSRLNDTIFGVQQMRELSGAVVGAGALGNEVVKALGLLSIRRVIVVDPDVVEPANLTTSVFFRRPGAEGLSKAKVLAEAAGSLFPETEFLPICEEVADVNPAILADCSLIFSCVDSDLARLEIAYISTRLNIPVSEGGLGGHRYSQGRVTWFPGRAGACYGCKLPAARRRELLTLWQANPFPCRIPAENVNVPSTPTMAAIIGSMQVEIGIRDWSAKQSESESVEIDFEHGATLTKFTNTRAVECPFHEEKEEILWESGDDWSAESLLGQGSQANFASAYIKLNWPVCASAKCQDCGEQWAPMVRIGYLQRYSKCPSCGSGELLVLETVLTLRRGDHRSALPLSVLGVLPGAPITIRTGRN